MRLPWRKSSRNSYYMLTHARFPPLLQTLCSNAAVRVHLDTDTHYLLDKPKLSLVVTSIGTLSVPHINPVCDLTGEGQWPLTPRNVPDVLVGQSEGPYAAPTPGRPFKILRTPVRTTPSCIFGLLRVKRVCTKVPELSSNHPGDSSRLCTPCSSSILLTTWLGRPLRSDASYVHAFIIVNFACTALINMYTGRSFFAAFSPMARCLR
jgi:hypothetical protein